MFKLLSFQKFFLGLRIISLRLVDDDYMFVCVSIQISDIGHMATH